MIKVLVKAVLKQLLPIILSEVEKMLNDKIDNLKQTKDVKGN